MKAYYNEFDKNAAAWLRELISDGLIAPGDVDERSIIDVDYKDLEGYTQHHFFAGIGGWSYALRLAQWPDNKPVWTASLPCQPFSAAGKGLGKADERHLLPHFLELVAKCKPDTIFGEQVERAIGHGWLDDLQATMEAENYAIGHCVLGAHSVSAAHIRQRLYWVANSISEQREQQQNERSSSVFRTAVQSEECVSRPSDIRSTFDGGMVYANEPGSRQGIEATETARHGDSIESAGGFGGMADSNIKGSQGRERTESADKLLVGQNGMVDWMGNTSGATSERDTGGLSATENRIRSQGQFDGDLCIGYTDASEINWVYCRDNKYRPVKSGIKPLVDGVPRGMVHGSDSRNTQEARKVRLKGYGNAIVPQVAAEFISAFMDTDPLRICGG